MRAINNLKDKAFYLVLFTLPMFTKLNNLFLALFLILFVLEGGFKNKWDNLKKHYKLFIPLACLFLLALIASLNHPSRSVFKYLEMYWSFLTIPIAIISSNNFDGEVGKKPYLALVLGCIATLLLCYGNVVYEMIAWKEPLHYFLRHRHLNHEFTEIADTHPTYLGVFITCATAYLLLETSIKKWVKIAIIVFFALGLIQLASRVAIAGFGIVLLYFLSLKFKKYWKQILISFGMAALFGSMLYVFSSEFLRERLTNNETIENDERFSRNIVSWEIFKEYPVLGVGFGRKHEARKAKYKDYGFDVAFQNNYNAHNQFLEYLSVNGIIGGIIFICIVIYLLITSWKLRDKFFFLLFLTFFLANFTESMLVRIKGIEFFAISVSLLATTCLKLEKNEDSYYPGL